MPPAQYLPSIRFRILLGNQFYTRYLKDEAQTGSNPDSDTHSRPDPLFVIHARYNEASDLRKTPTLSRKRRMKHFAMTLLLLAAPVSVTAGSLSDLQQQTNQAYEQMKQAENQASKAKKDVQIKQDNLRYHQEKVTEIEKELQAAQQAAQRAEENLSASRKRWNDRSDELYQQWRR